MMRLVMRGQSIFFFLLAVSAPIERLLTLEVAGYNIRPVYFIMLCFVIYGIAFRNVKLKAVYVGFILLLAAVLTANAAFSVQKLVSALNVGLAVLVLSASFTLFSLLRRHPQALREFTNLYVIAAAMWSIVAIVQWAASFMDHSYAYSFLGPFPRVQALTYEPSFLATYLVYPMFVSLGFKPIRPALSAVIFLGLLLTLSRTGLLAGAIGAVGLMLLYSHRFSKKKLVGFVVATAVLSTAMLLLPPTQKFFGTLADFVMAGVTLRDDASAKPRLQSWVDAVEVFHRSPLVGAGLGAYGYALEEIKELSAVGKPLKDIKTTNMFLEVLAEQGVMGGVLFGAWWMLPILIGLRNPNARLPGPIYAYLVLSSTFMFTQTWWRPYVWLPWVISLAYAYRRR